VNRNIKKTDYLIALAFEVPYSKDHRISGQEFEIRTWKWMGRYGLRV